LIGLLTTAASPEAGAASCAPADMADIRPAAASEATKIFNAGVLPGVGTVVPDFIVLICLHCIFGELQKLFWNCVYLTGSDVTAGTEFFPINF
jgi:hypothetical protein